jgi:hypothetical protein
MCGRSICDGIVTCKPAALLAQPQTAGAKTDADEIDGLAAAVARANLGAAVLADAAAWIAAAGARSVAQLETDDIDGALSRQTAFVARLDAPTGLAGLQSFHLC